MYNPQRRRQLTLVALALALYFALALSSAATKTPWCDEAWFASPAYNLVTHGHMGTTVLEPAGTWLRGIDRYTFWIVPLDVIAQAGWYEIFGFSLLSMRALSVVWGAAALLAWFYIILRLTDDARLALLTVFLMSVDYGSVTYASTGRMDMMCAALGYLAFATYLCWREQNLTAAVLASQALVAASGLTHPLGLLPFFGLLFLTLYFDRRRLGWRHALYAAVPYIVGALAWGLYIAKDPALFLAQFGGNVNGIHHTDRWQAVRQPLHALKLEITNRYLSFYGLGPDSAGPARLKVLILLAFVVGLACCLALRRRQGVRVLLALTFLYMGVMYLFEGHKNAIYLVHIIPFFVACLAVAVGWCWDAQRRLRPVIAAGLCCFLLAQVGGILLVVRQNSYRREFVPTVEYIRGCGGDLFVMGSAELAFGLGFDSNFVDDWRLGYYSGKRPDLIVIGKQYKGMIYGGLRDREPEAYDHVVRVLAGYEKVFSQGENDVYARPDSPCKQKP